MLLTCSLVKLGDEIPRIAGSQMGPAVTRRMYRSISEPAALPYPIFDASINIVKSVKPSSSCTWRRRSKRLVRGSISISLSRLTVIANRQLIEIYKNCLYFDIQSPCAITFPNQSSPCFFSSSTAGESPSNDSSKLLESMAAFFALMDFTVAHPLLKASSAAAMQPTIAKTSRHDMAHYVTIYRMTIEYDQDGMQHEAIRIV